MVFNTKKSVCMFVKSKKFKDLVPPEFLLDDNVLKYLLKDKYFGFIMSNDCKSDLDMKRQMRSIYGRGNIIISSFKHCTVPVKTQLLKLYVAIFMVITCSTLLRNVLITKSKLLLRNIQISYEPRQML